VETESVNNDPEVIDDIDIESEISDDEPEANKEGQTTAGDEVSGDALDDSQLGQDLGQLITEIRQGEEKFRQGEEKFQHSSEDTAGNLEADPFDPSHFSLDSPFRAAENQSEAPSTVEAEEKDQSSDSATAAETGMGPGAELSGLGTTAVRPEGGANPESDDAAATIAQLVSEIETALQRYTEGERRRADELIAEKEAQVAEQYRRVRNLADKVAKQKAQIQEAKNELKAKLELADRLHIEFDGIRQVLNGKLGVLEQLDKEEAAE
jgi:hypothetical protein